LTDLPTSASAVRVRFAPSPTGDLHIGGVRTALFNWLFARRHGGKFILRIEDTDQKRTQEQSLAGILDGLRWAGLNWDEGPDVGGDYGPYVQSQRLDLYKKWAQWLVDEGKAYRAYETSAELELISKAREANKLPPGYDRRGRQLTAEQQAQYEAEGRPFVVRLKVPLEAETAFTDSVRGVIRVQNENIQDAVLLKSDGFPTYHLANIIDDHFMAVSHVIRAEEWIPSTPLHMVLYQAFGWQPPTFAHVPVILHPQGGKISKRKHPEASVSYFMGGGYLPEATTNFLCNVGWNYGKMDAEGNEIQLFSKEEAASIFDVARVSMGGTKFDVTKLQWLNGEYIRRMSDAELAAQIEKFLPPALQAANASSQLLPRIAPLIRERIKLLTEAVNMIDFFFVEAVQIEPASLLIQKGMTAEQTKSVLSESIALLADLAALPDFEAKAQEALLRPLVDKLGLKAGQCFGVIRTAISGKTISPPLFESMEILGRERCLSRLQKALDRL
jgi:glutamyl-tRNA synthetase